MRFSMRRSAIAEAGRRSQKRWLLLQDSSQKQNIYRRKGGCRCDDLIANAMKLRFDRKCDEARQIIFRDLVVFFSYFWDFRARFVRPWGEVSPCGFGFELFGGQYAWDGIFGASLGLLGI